MPRVLDAMGAGMPAATAVEVLLGRVATGLTAAGAAQGTALALGTTPNNVVATTALSTGVRLPTATEGAVVGDIYLVVNNGANALAVYPGTGETINALAANTALSLATGATANRALFFRALTTGWFAIVSS